MGLQVQSLSLLLYDPWHQKCNPRKLQVYKHYIFTFSRTITTDTGHQGSDRKWKEKYEQIEVID